MNEQQAKITTGLADPSIRPNQGKPTLRLDPRTYSRATDCISCGLCLPTCPTYRVTGNEADSPRGRIQLMKGLADGAIDPTIDVRKHLDQCLDCRACETACPSGVVYHELIEEARPKIESHREGDAKPPLLRRAIKAVFPHRSRVKLALVPARLLQRVGLWETLIDVARAILPASVARMMELLPADGPIWPRAFDKRYPARKLDGSPVVPRGCIAYFLGCVSSALEAHLHHQAIALLQHVGYDVIVPPAQQCCGAIDHHAHDVDRARHLAQRNLAVFLDQDERPKFIVTAIGGCGAQLREYAHLLRDQREPTTARANDFTARVRDISEVLLDADWRPSRPLPRWVTYHHSCHLAHGQSVFEAPLQLLRRIEGLQIVPLAESDMCCGAAGTYNLTQPHMADALASRKLLAIRNTGATAVATGNIGCAMQIEREIRKAALSIDVVHPVSLMYEASTEPR